MKRRDLIAFALLIVIWPSHATAATVCVSHALPAPVEIAWSKIRDFGSHSAWIAGAPTITLQGGTGFTVGVKRSTVFKDGTQFDEILTVLDDRQHVIEYDVVGKLPIPAYNVHGRIALSPITADGSSLIERCLEYDTTLAPSEAEAFRRTREKLLAESLTLLADVLALHQ